jgi:hypothetical protein
MATNTVLIKEGTSVVFKASGGDVVWTPQNEAAGKGRISAVWDRGVSPRPVRYKWRMQTRWAATVTAGDMLRLYLVTSNAAATAAATDGGQTFGDAELASESRLADNCVFIGSVVASTAADQNECSSGTVEIYDRYISVAMWNAAAVKALTNTAGDHVFTLTPMSDDIQASA